MSIEAQPYTHEKPPEIHAFAPGFHELQPRFTSLVERELNKQDSFVRTMTLASCAIGEWSNRYLQSPITIEEFPTPVAMNNRLKEIDGQVDRITEVLTKGMDLARLQIRPTSEVPSLTEDERETKYHEASQAFHVHVVATVQALVPGFILDERIQQALDSQSEIELPFHEETLYSIIHDARTPLTAIKGFVFVANRQSSTLDTDHSTEKLERALNTVRSSVDTLQTQMKESIFEFLLGEPERITSHTIEEIKQGLDTIGIDAFVRLQGLETAEILDDNDWRIPKRLISSLIKNLLSNAADEVKRERFTQSTLDAHPRLVFLGFMQREGAIQLIYWDSLGGLPDGLKFEDMKSHGKEGEGFYGGNGIGMGTIIKILRRHGISVQYRNVPLSNGKKGLEFHAIFPTTFTFNKQSESLE